jgi:hypothetical protein
MDLENTTTGMKRILLILIIILTPLQLYPQKTTRDSLQSVLKRTTNAVLRMELLTNLTDISHDKQKTVYAKELLAEAEKNRNDYYKEVAYTELICYFIKESTLDSILFYRKEAEKRLTNNDYKQALLSYAKMLYDSKAIMYANSKQQKKILENVYFRLETDKNMSIPERIAANQTIGIYLTKIPEFEENGKKTQDARKYFQEALSLGKNLELRERGLMMPYILYMSVATTSAMPKLQAQYCKQYYQTMIDWLNLPEMKRRPYYTREHLIHAASGMAVTAPVFGKKNCHRILREIQKTHPGISRRLLLLTRIRIPFNLHQLLRFDRRNRKRTSSLRQNHRPDGTIKDGQSAHLLYE